MVVVLMENTRIVMNVYLPGQKTPIGKMNVDAYTPFPGTKKIANGTANLQLDWSVFKKNLFAVSWGVSSSWCDQIIEAETEYGRRFFTLTYYHLPGNIMGEKAPYLEMYAGFKVCEDNLAVVNAIAFYKSLNKKG